MLSCKVREIRTLYEPLKVISFHFFWICLIQLLFTEVSNVHIIWYNKEGDIPNDHEGKLLGHDSEVSIVPPLCQSTLPGFIPWQRGLFTCVVDQISRLSSFHHRLVLRNLQSQEKIMADFFLWWYQQLRALLLLRFVLIIVYFESQYSAVFSDLTAVMLPS